MLAGIGSILVLGLLLLSCLPNLVLANGLAGERGGLSTYMAKHGLVLDAVYTGEFVRNLDPGLIRPRKETIYDDNLDLTATLDTEHAGLWSGGTFFIYGLLNHGGFPSARVIGDLQTVSNIEANRNQFILHQAWYEQRFAGGETSLLAGLHDLNSEFYSSEFATLFVNSSFGIGPEISGNVAAPLFPRAALGLRLKFMPQDGWYMQGAVYDGDSATRSVSNGEGYMSILETALLTGEGGRYKLGAWYHSADRTFAGNRFGSDFGAYGLAEATLFSFAGSAAVGGFVQLGWVPKQRNEITRYVGAGLHLSGLPLRRGDEFGLATANAYTRTGTEHVIELTWHVAVLPGMTIQPSMQWILNPGGDPAASTIRVALLRFEIAL